MKKLFIISVICGAQLLMGKNWDGGTCYAQGHWTQKADFGGTSRHSAVGFSIGTKGYIGTGYQNAGNTKNFWEYDQATNAWTQKADFGGTARSVAVGFSIGTKGYIGTGYDINGFMKDFWEWNQLTNIWTQKADFGGTARVYATGLSIGTNGYIGGGQQSPDFSDVGDFWQYNPATDTWTQKANFGGGLRTYAVGFSIGTKGYMGTGHDGALPRKDFWEYDPLLDTWTQKADVGPYERFYATGFSIGTKGYIGTGEEAPTFLYVQDFWQWDQATNTWTEQAEFAGAPRIYAVGFSIGTKGYVGTGMDTTFMTHKDFWEFSTDSVAVSCGAPTGESSTHTFNTATLNWNAVTNALFYRVRYKVAGTIFYTKVSAFTNTKKLLNLLHGTTYVWQVRTVCLSGLSAWSPEQTFFTGPFKLSDEQAATSFDVFPNPFESSTSISFSVQEDSRVQLELLDVSGRKLQTVFDETATAGDHVVTLNRNGLSAGLYFLQMRMNDPNASGQVSVITKKVMIVQ